MNLQQHLKEKLLPILASRLVIFFFASCLLTLFLYGIGIVQEFTDSTQLALLRLYAILGIILSISSVYAMILAITRFVAEKKKRYLLRASFYLILLLFAAATVLSVIFIITMTGGNAEIQAFGIAP